MKPGKVLLFGLLGLLLGQVIAWWQQSASPLLSAVLTVAAGAIPLVLDYFKSSHTPAPSPPPRPPYSPYPLPATPRRSRSGITAGALVAGLLVLSLVGGGIAYGVAYAVGILTGNESSTTQRLAKPVTGNAGALTVRIEQVGVSAHYTQVRLTATNKADFPVSIPLYNNCQLVEPNRVALEARTGFTTSEVDVPAGDIQITKDIVFDGTPSASATSLTLTCSTLYWQGFGQPESLEVKGIALTAPA